MVGLSAVSGCVVTDKVEFEEPVNSPPAFIVDETDRLQPGEIIFVPNSGASSWTFNFRVRDIDVEQHLTAHWRILKYNVDETRGEVQLPVTGSELRNLGIDIPSIQLLSDNCHRIEVAVSGSFLEEGDPGFTSRTDRFDIALFAFWIWEGDQTNIDVAKLVETCNAQLYEPTVTAGGAGGAAGSFQ